MEIQREIKPLNAAFFISRDIDGNNVSFVSFNIFFVGASVLCKKEVVSSH